MVVEDVKAPWLLAGDFNALLNENDKKGGSGLSKSSCKLFHKFFDDYCFKDVCFQGSKFTWNRGSIF